MHNTKITYQIKTASEEEIFEHLKECNHNFIPPLDTKVDLKEYSKKIYTKSITFEAWDNKRLIALIAAYFNDLETQTAFITNVSTIPNYVKKGLASKLLHNCIKHAKALHFQKINLKVLQENSNAILLYKKFNFTVESKENTSVTMTLQLT